MERVIAVVGATATGKSRLALALAEELGGEIVNADALQVYRGFDIGTAKPSPAERRRVPHHLIDILEPHERYSAGEFARRARSAVEEIEKRSRVPILVGGSGLYLRAVLEGISPAPQRDEAVRRRLEVRLEREGLESLRRQLVELDPVTARRLRPGDRQRILRALEVVVVSARPLSQWIAEQPFGNERLPAVRLGLTLPRSILYDRIRCRVDRMVEEGWVDEVKRLLDRDLDPAVPAFQAIGYRQIARYLRGDWSFEKALTETKRATCRFAKRQETWFRKEPEIVWFGARHLDMRVHEVMDLLSRSGFGRANGQA